MRPAHRLVCIASNGPTEGRLDAAHSCGNRTCINPRHLSWKTRSANEADKLRHGTANRGERHGRSKLTTTDVLAIRSLVETLKRSEIAAMYGVSLTTVSEIRSGSKWGWLSQPAASVA